MTLTSINATLVLDLPHGLEATDYKKVISLLEDGELMIRVASNGFENEWRPTLIITPIMPSGSSDDWPEQSPTRSTKVDFTK